MKSLAILSIVLSLGLGACATTSVNTGKTLAIAWQSLDAASVAADTAVHAGKLKGVQAATVATDLRKAQAALQIATAAYGVAGSNADPSIQIVVATTALAEVTAIVAGVN